MLRILIVFALLLPAAVDVQARGFRFSFRPRASALLHPSERMRPSSSNLVVYNLDRREPAQTAPVRSVLDHAAEAVHVTTPIAPPAMPRILAQKAVERSAHWCDNGAIVGSGQGFCVVKVTANDPT